MQIDRGMGFRNIRDFNTTLLGKLAWRPISYPEKMVLKVFKARYYPSDSYLIVKIGSNSSYIWRSMLKAHGMIKQGISCRVGNGQSMSILNVPWLPDAIDPYVHSLNEALMNQKVYALMITCEKAWDMDLIDDLLKIVMHTSFFQFPLREEDGDNWY